MRALVAPALVFVLLNSGCLSTGDDEAPAAFPETAPPGMDAAAGESSLLREYSGTILLRPVDDPLFTGDSPHQCFKVPPGTRSFVARLEWSPPQQMGMDFSTVDGKNYTNSWGEVTNALDDVLSPLEMKIDAPPATEWVGYVGPGIVGGGVTWTLQLTFDVERAGAMVEETYVPDDFDCPT